MNRIAFVDRLASLLFIVGLVGVSFLSGVAVGVYRFFPYGPLHDAKAAVEALQEKYMIPDDPYTEAIAHDRAGVTTYDPARAFNGYTFIMANRNGEYKAVLIDMAGRTLHEWHVPFSKIWPQAPHVIDQADDDQMYWHGAHLFPNGDLLFNFGGGNFPYGGGLVKLNRDSKVLWALPRNTHHDLDITKKGVIYTAAHNYRSSGLRGLPHLLAPYYEDVVLKVSPEGKVSDEISMLKILQDSDYKGLLSLTYREHLRTSSRDPLHLNAVEVLPGRLAHLFPMFKAGDLLVSFRNVNTIAVIDPEAKAIKWAMTGKFVHQHDPDFLDNGNILVFDNAGEASSYDQSRLLEIDPVSHRIVWRYAGSVEEPFFSRERGNQQPLPNGNVLIVESDRGRVFEVTRAREIVWEYYNRVQSDDGENKVGWVSEGLRITPGGQNFVD